MARSPRFVLTQKQVEALTLAQAQGLQTGTYIYSTYYRNADGTSARARVTSVKTWKTRPTEVRIGWKYGLKVFGSEDETTIDRWSLEPEWSFQESLQPTGNTEG